VMDPIRAGHVNQVADEYHDEIDNNPHKN